MKKQNYSELRNLLTNGDIRWDFTKDAIDAVDSVLSSLEEDGDADIQDLIWQTLDSSCMYYSDAFNYLQECNIIDFEDAFKQGFYNLCGIYYYYLEEEVYDLINRIGLEY